MIHCLSNGYTINAAVTNAPRLPTTQQRISKQIQTPPVSAGFLLFVIHFKPDPLLNVIRKTQRLFDWYRIFYKAIKIRDKFLTTYLGL